MDAPQIDVVRGRSAGLELRAASKNTMPTMAGHFSVFDTWYEINSWFEGDFIERFVSGAFEDTFAQHWDDSDVHRIKVQFQHGYDPSVGARLLGRIAELREDTGGYYEVPLFDTSYNRDLVPGLEAGEYGASFRFRVVEDRWNKEPGTSEHNPKGLPERTITKAHVAELGPVAFGASPSATSGLRSLTDAYYEAVRNASPRVFEDACRAAGREVPSGAGQDARSTDRPRRKRTGRGRPVRTELKALPDTVLKRGLDLHAITTRRRGQELIEARLFPAPPLKVVDADEKVEIAGYVARYDEPRDVAGDGGWTEIWAPGACTRNINNAPDVRLLFNGEGEPLARTKREDLSLTSDDYGLHLRATIDPTTREGEEVSLALQRGDQVDVRIGLDVIKQYWDNDHTYRKVEEVFLHDIDLICDADPRAADGLAELHNSRNLVDFTPDGEHMSLELAQAIRDKHHI